MSRREEGDKKNFDFFFDQKVINFFSSDLLFLKFNNK